MIVQYTPYIAHIFWNSWWRSTTWLWFKKKTNREIFEGLV